jgi:thymidylate kinase
MLGFRDGAKGGSGITLGRNSRGLLVCFSGIDGAGKSTLAKGLVDVMRQRGIETSYLWGGFARFMLFRPFVALAKALVFDEERDMEQVELKGKVLKNSFLSKVYHYLMLSDYVFQAFVRIGLPLVKGRSVICDRYIYDLVASMGIALDYPASRTLALLNRCLAFLPKPDFVFLVDLPEALAYQRKDDIISLDFLSVRRKIYLQMAQLHRMTTLDGSSDPREVAQLVTRTVLERLEGTS